MSVRRGKFVTLVSAFATLSLLIAVWVCRKDLLTSYRLYQLEEDPGLLPAFIEQPEAAPQGRAVSRFLETEAGKQTLFLLFADIVLRGILPEDLSAEAVQGIVWTQENHAFYRGWTPTHDPRHFHFPIPATSSAALGNLKKRLSRLEGTSFRWPLQPWFRFQFLEKKRLARCMPHLAQRVQGRQPPLGIVCLLELDLDHAVPSLLGALNSGEHQARASAAQLVGRWASRIGAGRHHDDIVDELHRGPPFVPRAKEEIDAAVAHLALRIALERFKKNLPSDAPNDTVALGDDAMPRTPGDSLSQVSWGFVRKMADWNPRSDRYVAYRYLLSQFFMARRRSGAEVNAVAYAWCFADGKERYHSSFVEAWITTLEGIGLEVSSAETKRIQTLIAKHFVNELYMDDLTGCEEEIEYFRQFMADFHALLGPGRFEKFAAFLRSINLDVHTK